MPLLTNATYLNNPTEYIGPGTNYGHAGVVLQCLNVLQTSGRWAMVSWSDGTTYHNDGSWPATYNDLLAGSWFNLQAVNADNAAGDKQSWCVIHISATYSTNQYSIKHSKSVGFSGGAAATPPTASDQVYTIGTSDTVGGQWFTNFGQGAGSSYCAPLGCADNDSNSFIFIGFVFGGGIMMWMTDTVLGAEDADDYPYVFAAKATNWATSSVDGSTLTPLWAYEYGAGAWSVHQQYADRLYGNVGGFPNYYPQASPLAGAPAYRIASILYGRDGSSGTYAMPKGWSRLVMWYGNNDASSTPQKFCYYESEVDGLVFAGYKTALMPWDGTPVSLTNTGTWASLGGDSKIWDKPSNAAAPQVGSVSPASGGDINADPATARFTPATFTVTLDASSGELPVVVVEMGSVPYYGFVAYDGSAFSKMFADHSSVVDHGDGSYDFSILPTGGWWKSPITLRAGGWREV